MNQQTFDFYMEKSSKDKKIIGKKLREIMIDGATNDKYFTQKFLLGHYNLWNVGDLSDWLLEVKQPKKYEEVHEMMKSLEEI